MATGFTALQDLKECPVCREEFSDPRALPCDHLLCQDFRGLQLHCIDDARIVNESKFIESMIWQKNNRGELGL